MDHAHSDQGVTTARRSDAGTIRLSGRDTAGLVLCREMYGAPSWQGLGATEDERYRIAATADGGIWLLRTPYPQPVSELAGTRRIIETATKVVGGMWGDEGSSRVQHAWTADPGIARSLDIGQAGYLHAGGCTWLQVARPRPSPLRLPPPPRPPVVVIPPAVAEARAVPVTVPATLDDAFGPTQETPT